MTFLKINGLAISAAEYEEQTFYVQGADSENINGWATQSDQGVKRYIDITTTPLSKSDAVAQAGWMMGLGEMWSFEAAAAADQQWGSRGTGASAASTWQQDNTNKKYGTYGIQLDGVSSEYFQVTADLAPGGGRGWAPDDFTIMFWRKEDAGTQYHYAYVSDNGSVTEYRNTTASTYNITNTVTITTGASGSVRLLGKAIADGTTNVSAYYDDLVILPFAATSDMVSAAYNLGTQFSSLPLVSVSGDAIMSSSAKTFFSRVRTMPVVSAVVGGTFASTHHKIIAELKEHRTA